MRQEQNLLLVGNAINEVFSLGNTILTKLALNTHGKYIEGNAIDLAVVAL